MPVGMDLTCRRGERGVERGLTLGLSQLYEIMSQLFDGACCLNDL